MANDLIELTDSNFESEVIGSDIPVLVDFWAVWCGPCRMVAPEVEKLANEKAGALKVGKLNVDENRETAVRYSISSIPALLLFKDGDVVKKIVGAMPKDKILEEISSFI